MTEARRAPPARTGAAVAAVLVISFVLNQAPFLFSSNPRTLGADGDSWFHVAIQTHLMNPAIFAADPEVPVFYVASRPWLELTIHRSVVALSWLTGDLLVANMIGFWIINLVFLWGCVRLAERVLRSTLAAAAFAAASAGLSLALYAWWGMPFGAVIPHDLGLAVVPWLVLAYLHYDDRPRAGVAVFLAAGLAANLYPLQPAYLTLVLLATTASARRFRVGPLGARGAAFLLGASPAIVTAALGTLQRLSTVPPDVAATADSLLERHYGHLIPSSPAVFALRLFASTVWLFAGIALVAALRNWRTLTDDERRLFWFGIWSTALAAFGLAVGTVSRPLLAFLFHRSSALLYIPAYLGTLAAALHLARRAHLGARAAALVLAVLVAGNAWWRTPLGGRLRGSWPLQTSAPYYDLAAWAREHTPEGSLFLVPMGGRTTYFAFRVYAQRPVMLHYALGEMVLADPRLGARFAALERDVAPLYAGPSSTEAFLAVARRYGVRFIVTDDTIPRRPELPVVFRNDVFTVYDAAGR